MSGTGRAEGEGGVEWSQYSELRLARIGGAICGLSQLGLVECLLSSFLRCLSFIFYHRLQVVPRKQIDLLFNPELSFADLDYEKIDDIRNSFSFSLWLVEELE